LNIAFIVILFSSCEKEKLSEYYNFQDYLFTEDIICYDTLGNQYDSLSYMYLKDDFVYEDGFRVPYKSIEIFESNVFKINYIFEGNSGTYEGVVDYVNDSAYFYVDEISPYNLLLKGKITSDEIRIEGCGYIYYTYIEDMLIYESESKITSLNIPEISSLLNDFPNPRVNNNRICRKYLYFQRFDLVYDKVNE